MKLLVAISVLALFLSAQPIAVVEKIQGDVRILKKGSIKRQSAQKDSELFKGDMVITYKDSMATLHLESGSYVKLDERTRLRITDAQTIAQESGLAFLM